MEDIDFLQNCAIAAMQGIQEANSKIGIVADFAPDELSKKAFDIAERMLLECHKRMSARTHLKPRKNG